MAKIDIKKELKHLYRPSKSEFSLFEVPPMRFLMIDGRGDPNTAPAYTMAVQALFSVAYTLKFMSKNDLGKDYVVPPLEGLWWATDMQTFTNKRDKSQWLWTMMIMVPDWIPDEMVVRAQAAAGEKKALPALPKMRCEYYGEGLAVQILHIGPYDEEGPVLKQMHTEYLPAQNLTFNGKHHEIYLSDPRRVAPEKLKTILRQPVRRM
ncbi:MAG: GyrI-like domain-containing protein [Gammaproteobacteria bacterium]|nr:GyrI-like domain-containing protein [Gammaproteobacteria bacterium]